MTEEIRGLTIEVDQDEWPDNPRNWDNLGTMVCFHNRYNLGDKHSYRSENYDGWDGLKNAIERDNGKCLVLPIYMYEHSGIALSTSNEYPFNDRWDAGTVGLIYVPIKNVRKEYGKAGKKERETALEVLRGEIETYGAYLNGDVYYVTIKDENEEVLDSCGGFYDEDEAMNEAKEMAEYFADKLEREKPTRDRKALEEAGQIPLDF